ncbi:MAG: site-specific DNA-methyltransferase [Bacillota bacterium]|nr:site-specific DNA-methyltransferase [Bacillota bacterium]
MITLSELTTAYEEGKRLFEQLMNEDAVTFNTTERYGSNPENIIAHGDNLQYMIHLLKDKNMAGKLQLVYVDPPFFSSGKYQASIRLESELLGKSSLMKLEAYDDNWSKGMPQYLAMLTARLFAMKELMSDTGCIWMHLDWHGVYYVKVIMDQIFGESNFINEVVWTYKSGGSSKKSFAKKHDTLLVYGKTKKYKFNPLTEKSYNRGLKPYRFKGVEEFCDDVGWYTMVNMKDVWSIDMVGRTSAERTGYATQKPEKLMQRIIASCTDEGDLCADFFAGSGTLGAVCEKMGRKWIMCDEGELSVTGQIHRMGGLQGNFEVTSASEEIKGILKYDVSGGLIRLLSYEAELPDGMEEYEEELTKFINRDSLCLVKCWSAGRENGDVHEADDVFSDIWGIHETDDDPEQLSVFGYDVFGRRVRGVMEE